MSSILTTIYDKLEALTVTYVDKSGGSVSPTVYSQETFVDSIQTAHIPARILFSPNGNMVIGPGGLSQSEDTIIDLCLLEAAAQGAGGKEEIPQVTRYIAAYKEKIGTLWQLLSTWHTEDQTTRIQYTSNGRFEYPSGSGSFWYGVRFEITITEIV